MAYNSPNHFPYYAAVDQHQQQQRLAYQQQLQMQQAPQYVQRDMRAHDQDALRRLSAGTPRAPMRRPTDYTRTAIAEDDEVPPLPSAYGQQHHHQQQQHQQQQQHHYASYATSPTSRSMTAPPGAGFVPAMSSLTLPPIRGGAAMPMSPPTRNAPPNMRQPHLLPPGVAGTGVRPAPSTAAYQEMMYSCSREECQQRFPNKPELDAHEKIHKYSEKPQACPYPGCNWRFDFPSDVKYHLKCHTNEKDYSCDFPDCGKQYQRKHDLFRHVRDKHPGHPVPGYA